MPVRRDPPPMRTNDASVVRIGTALWAVAFVVLLAVRGTGWWLGTCAAGVGLGLVGIAYVRRREAAIARDAAAEAAEAAERASGR